MVKIVNANIVTAFNVMAVGTRVLEAPAFWRVLEAAVESFDFAAQRVPGQGFVSLPESACAMVSAGVGERRDDPSAYVCRSWRGRVGAYLRREHAAKPTGVAAIVYTATAYLSDPDVAGDAEESARVRESGATHVLVTILAFAGPRAPLPPGTFVRNLAGANKEALVWTADEIRAKAVEIQAYDEAWSVVAD